MDSGHSVSMHIANLRNGADLTAAHQFIFDRYFARLAGLAKKRLGGGTLRVVSGEDVASEALAAFFKTISVEGKFPDLKDRKHLWPLLAQIAQFRAINNFKREIKKSGESVLVLASDGEALKLDEIIEGEVTPESADELFAQAGNILDELKRHDAKFSPPKTHYYDIAVCKLQGFTSSQIAEKLGYQNKKSVERQISEIRIIWKCLAGGLASVEIRSDTQEFNTSIATETLIIGRQRKGEPEPIWDRLSNVDGVATRRLIITSDNRVSRNHCKITIEDETQVVVDNVSRKSEILVESEKVLAGESRTVNSNCHIVLPGFDISVSLR